LQHKKMLIPHLRFSILKLSIVDIISQFLLYMLHPCLAYLLLIMNVIMPVVIKLPQGFL